ncbi:outer membrane protein with beta-barrel domain [Winogradskyella epiphytica]|uniref:Outer membrane protein with beta-barrel domain n=1 Tax=Winogradskyella epiphytica TaxID=262005 RepID=A0A2V4X8G2_9FLAO|nr:outer membrane beta-barrel protein [Winogradskyella epiphytica]PYE81889.1 outer membrane protein with beta-barrel domain [Winogradskyella epiphytica]
MRKLILCAFAVIAFATVEAQDFKLGVSAALPMGDSGDISSFGINLDANYLWGVSDEFSVGLAAGYHHYFGKDYEDSFGGVTYTYEAEDAGFLPIGAAARFNASEEFTIGLDLGYGIGISPDGNDGGFYYAPKVQYSVSESLDIVLAYKGVSLDGGSFDALSLGLEFGL